MHKLILNIKLKNYYITWSQQDTTNKISKDKVTDTINIELKKRRTQLGISKYTSRSSLKSGNQKKKGSQAKQRHGSMVSENALDNFTFWLLKLDYRYRIQ